MENVNSQNERKITYGTKGVFYFHGLKNYLNFCKPGKRGDTLTLHILNELNFSKICEYYHYFQKSNVGNLSTKNSEILQWEKNASNVTATKIQSHWELKIGIEDCFEIYHLEWAYFLWNFMKLKKISP